MPVAAAPSDAAGQGLVGRALAADEPSDADTDAEWSLALSGADRVAALEQIRQDLGARPALPAAQPPAPA